MSDRDAAMYILDEVITKSLHVDVSDKFDTFVKVLLEFGDDDTAVALGKQLMERLPPDSQARVQQKLSMDQPQGGPPPGGYPQQGYPQQLPAHSQPGYPNPAGYPAQQQVYPPQQPSYQGYPPQQPSYQGYPPQQPSYPPQQPSYQGYPPGYPPQQPDAGYFPGPPMPGEICVHDALNILSQAKLLSKGPMVA